MQPSNSNGPTVSAPESTAEVKANIDQVPTPVGAGIRIDNVNKSLWQYIRKRKLRQLLLFMPFVIIWEVFAIFLIIRILKLSSGSSSSNNNQGLGFLVAAPFILFYYWLYHLKRQFEDAFLEEFALANHYSFDKNGTVDETYGSIFRLKGSQSVSDVVTGSYNSNSLRLFLYELVVGSGRYQKRYNDTVIELDLHGQLPDLLLVNKQSRYGQLSLNSSFGIKNTIQLEGDFNKYFTLYGPRGNEIEALEVFSPDTMALMEDESKHYTVEFAGNRIYIYCNGFITTTEQLTQVFSLAKKLIDKIAPLAARLQKDSAMVAAPTNIITVRKQHPLIHKIGIAASIALATVGIGATVLAIFLIPKPMPSSLPYNHTAPQPVNYELSETDIDQAISVSNSYLDYLAQNNAIAAYALTSPGWHDRYGPDVGLNDYKLWNVVGESRSIYAKASGVDSNGLKWVVIVYKYSKDSDVFYVRLGVEKGNLIGGWRIYLEQADTKPLKP